MKLKKSIFLLGAISLTLSAPSAFALTWDITSGDNPTLTDGSGNWNTTGGNLVWNNAANPNVIWSQTSTTVGTQTAVFGSGTDGTVDQWLVTLDSQMAATSLTFNNTGYKLTGSTLYLTGNTTVAANKTATINSFLNSNGIKTNTINSGATLNLGGGIGNSAIWAGAGTLNFTGGTTDIAGNNRFNNAATNLTGGSVSLAGDASSGNWIGYTAGQSTTYTVSGTGILNVNSASGAYLAIGRAASNTTDLASLVVKTGGEVNIGTTGAGSLRISQSAGATYANGKLDVQGGTLTVGTGNIGNQIVFFNAGAGNGYTGEMTQSGGAVTTQGIRFGNSGLASAYSSGASATLKLSGGNLYVGTLGITADSALTAGGTQITIQLQGGTLGADQNWVSSLDMKLGTTGGGPTIKAADSVGTARDIALSGILSNDGAVNGTLTKTGGGILTLSGVSTYTGNTLVNNGTLALTNTGGLNFEIGAGNGLLPGTSNQITGNVLGTVTLDGAFTFDLTSASTTINDFWNIVDVGSLSGSSGFTSNFNIVGFTPDGGGDLWSFDNAGTIYQFSESSGLLTVVPEPSALGLLSLGALGLAFKRRR